VPEPLLCLMGCPGGEAGAEAALLSHNWGVHCPPRGILLAQPQRWQVADLEAAEGAAEAGAGAPAASLHFELSGVGAGPCAGFLFWSRFLFEDPALTLDTLAQPTHWATLFVPFAGGAGGAGGAARALELLTETPDQSRPSEFELWARPLRGGEGGEALRSAASVESGRLAWEYFV